MAKRVDLIDGYAHFLDNQAPHSLRSMLGKDWRTVVNPSIYQALEPNFTYSEIPSSLILYLRNCVEYLNSEKYIGSDLGKSDMLERCFRCDYLLLFVELVKADDAFFTANEDVQHLKKFGRPSVDLM